MWSLNNVSWNSIFRTTLYASGETSFNINAKEFPRVFEGSFGFFGLGFVRRQFLSTTQDFYSCGQALSRCGVTTVCRSIRLNAAQLPWGNRVHHRFRGYVLLRASRPLSIRVELDMQCIGLRLSGRYFPSSECRSNNGIAMYVNHSNVNLNLIGHTFYTVLGYTDNERKRR